MITDTPAVKLTIREMIQFRHDLVEKAKVTLEEREAYRASLENLGIGYSYTIGEMIYGKARHTISQITNMIDSACWKHFLEASSISDYMSSSKRNATIKEIDESPTTFNNENVQNMINVAKSIYLDSITELISEVFRKVTGQRVKVNGQYVGVNTQKIEKSFRTSGNVWIGDYSVDVRQGCMIEDLESACYILNKKQRPRYPKRITDTLSRFKPNDALIEAENEYFQVRCFKNQNQLITFKDMDTVEKLNQYGADGSALPSPDFRIVY